MLQSKIEKVPRGIRSEKFVTKNMGFFCFISVDGKWGSWGKWGTCSLTCGGGQQSRLRTCSDPAPQYGGASCSGTATSSQTCNTQNCPSE